MNVNSNVPPEVAKIVRDLNLQSLGIGNHIVDVTHVTDTKVSRFAFNVYFNDSFKLANAITLNFPRDGVRIYINQSVRVGIGTSSEHNAFAEFLNVKPKLALGQTISEAPKQPTEKMAAPEPEPEKPVIRKIKSYVHPEPVTEYLRQTSEDKLVTFDGYLRLGSDKEPKKKNSTRADYLYTARIFLSFAGSHPITHELAREFIRGLEEKGNKASTINRHIWALKSYFRFLANEAENELHQRSQELPPGTTEVGALRQQVDQMREEQRIREFADLKLRGLRKVQYQPKFLRNEEWDKLYNFTRAPILNASTFPYDRFRAQLEFALLMVYCGAGLRRSEGINLRKEDLHEAEGYIRVIGKGDKEAQVPVEPEVFAAINDYMKAIVTMDWVSLKGSPYVFPGKLPGTHLSKSAADHIIKGLCRRAGFPEMHVHGLHNTAHERKTHDSWRRKLAIEKGFQEFLALQKQLDSDIQRGRSQRK